MVLYTKGDAWELSPKWLYYSMWVEAVYISIAICVSAKQFEGPLLKNALSGPFTELMIVHILNQTDFVSFLWNPAEHCWGEFWKISLEYLYKCGSKASCKFLWLANDFCSPSQMPCGGCSAPRPCPGKSKLKVRLLSLLLFSSPILFPVFPEVYQSSYCYQSQLVSVASQL